MRLLLLLFIACTNILFAGAQLLIRNTTLVDVENKKLIPSQTILVENGKISAIGKNVPLPQGAQIIDGKEKYLVPGWVDAHVHFFQNGGIYTRPDVIDLRKYKPYNEEITKTHQTMESFLRRYTAAGITTVVDVGSSINFLKQRDSFRSKPYAPSVYMTGPLLTTWEPDVYKNLKEEEPFYEMKTTEDARKYVQKQLPFHPDFIKIWYIVNSKNPDSSARITLPLVKAVIAETHKHGLRVAVHATERITAQLAVESGADFLVHNIDDEPLDAAFVQLLKTKKVVLCPTLVVVDNYFKVFGQEYEINNYDFAYSHPIPLNSVIDLKTLPDSSVINYYNYVQKNREKTKNTASLQRSNLKKLLDGGVTIATGTDAGNIGTQHVSSYFDELAAMQQSGFDLWQLLQASTINGAKAVGKEAEFGSIKPGKRADMLLLNNNPLESLSNWNKIDWVINKGLALKPDSLLIRSPEELAGQQLLAYNAHNLEAFLEPYAGDVEVYTFPGKLDIKGKEAMRKAYGFLNNTPKLYCRLLNRIVQGNFVIDHEEIWTSDKKPFYGVAIYEINNSKIQKVYFAR